MYFNCTQCVQNSLARIDFNTTKYSHIAPIVLYWLPVQQWSMFKTAAIVFRFLQSGYPNYFRALLNPRKSFCNTRSSQMEGDVLEVPEFIPYVQKSSKQMSF